MPTLTATVRRRVVQSPVGPLELLATDRGLCRLHFDGKGREPLTGSPESGAVLDRAEAQLAEYFAGTRTHFDLPLDLCGTEFQLQVWAQLQAIPYGGTASYGDLARRLGRPGASRAVGMANNRNPVAIVVPCHRVVGADGSLTGYAGGLDRKRRLLDLEAGSPALL